MSTSPEPAPTLRIAPMLRRHLRQVRRIEEAAYAAPWSITIFLSELGQRTSRRYSVASLGPRVVGYSGLMVVGDEGHVTTLTVDPPYQGRRIGTALMIDLARAACGRQVRVLTLEVRASNEIAQKLYRSFGFAPVGLRRNYYPETGEDAIIMTAYDIDTPAYARRLEQLREAAFPSEPTTP